METPEKLATASPLPLADGSAPSSLIECVEALSHELEGDPNYQFEGLSDANGETYAAKLARVRKAAVVMQEWLRLCEMGLQDVVPEWVKPTVERLWEKTDEVFLQNPPVEPPSGRL